MHVWCATLNHIEADYISMLSPDELNRARRFRFERERRRFVIGRGSLRIILGRYLNLPAEKLEFRVGTFGKPALMTDPALRFNLAHSGDLVLYAVTHDRELGIDLEEIHPVANIQQLADQFFSPLERAELAAFPEDRKLDAFFSGWIRKEAYLKARGDGLGYPLDQFSVSLGPEAPARLLESKEGMEELVRWSLQILTPSPAPGYVAALAVEGHAQRLAQWQF